jgi:hypothetical protein
MRQTIPPADDSTRKARLARGMDNIPEGLTSLSTPSMDGSIDPAAIGLPPTWMIDLTAATRSNVAVDESAGSSSS